MKGFCVLIVFLVSVAFQSLSQTAQLPAPPISSVEQLQSAYTGTTAWNSSTGIFTFTSSGVIAFTGRTEITDNIWHIPSNVTKIVIDSAVQVTGEFTWGHQMTFEGKDQNSSVLFGTPNKGVLNAAGLDKKYTCVAYSAFYGYGNGDNYILNLTCLNPLGFMFTGKNSCRLHLENVRGVDTRGGSSNHSDGISAASGSTMNNCYLETGDDAIKVYADVLVENTTIVMVQNCVPIQYTWGGYGSGAKGTFRNVTISGTSGRGSDKSVFNMASSNGGTGYNKTIVMENCTIENPNATLFVMEDNNVISNVTITNSKINVRSYGPKFGKGVISICGSAAQSNYFDCLQPTKLIDEIEINSSDKAYPNPFTNSVSIATSHPNYRIYSIFGNELHVSSNYDGRQQNFKTSTLPKGIYFMCNKASHSLKVVKQ